MASPHRDPMCRATATRIDPSFVWAIWLLAAVVGAVGLRGYRVDNALADWTPSRTSTDLSRSYIVIGGERGVFDPDEAAKKLADLDTVTTCISPGTVAMLRARDDLTPEDFVVSRDGRYAGLYCFAKPDTNDQQFVIEVRQTLERWIGANYDKLAIGGPAIFRDNLNHWSQERLTTIMGLIVCVGFVLLWRVTGSTRSALEGTTGVVLSQIILMGFISRTGRPVDMAVSMVPPLMMALGFSYAAHRALRPGVSFELVLSLLTTAAGIGSFVAAGVEPIRMFAIDGVVGLLLVWLAVMTLVQPQNPQTRAALNRSPACIDRVRDRCVAVSEQHPYWIIVTAAVLTIGAVGIAPILRFETNPLNYFPRTSSIRRDYATLEHRLTGMLPFQITVKGDADPTAMLLETPGVRKVIREGTSDSSQVNTYWCLADTDSIASLSQQEQAWRAWADSRGVTLAWGGVAAQLNEIGAIVYRVAILTLPMMGLLAAIVIGVISRSVLLAAASAWVNLLPAAALIFMAGLLRLPLDLPSLMIGGIAIGMAVDDTIHLVTGLVRRGSMRVVLAECWRPCVGSSLLVAVGMAVFTLSPFTPTAQFGLLLSIAVLGALVGDLFLLPAIVHLVGYKHARCGKRDMVTDHGRSSGVLNSPVRL